MSVGDGEPHEDAFRAFSGLGFGVGPPSQPTVARRQLPNVQAAFARRPSRRGEEPLLERYGFSGASGSEKSPAGRKLPDP